MRTMVWCVMLCSMLTLVGSLSAQEKGKSPAGFRGEFLVQLDDVEKKIVRLAEAVPEAKYGWRPGRDVRSVSEIYMHIATGNYSIISAIGAKAKAVPADVERTIKEKRKVVEYMKDSFLFVRQSVVNLKDEDLDRPTTLFGQATTYRGALLTAAVHMHEHLGQSIAYARMCGVVPPWSAATR